MKPFKEFNPIDFNSYVKFVKETIGYQITDTKAKYLIMQAIKDCNYDPVEVLNYLNEIILEKFPCYMLNLNKLDWKKVYASNMYDKDLALMLQEVLSKECCFKDNNFYQDCFFETVSNLGVNPLAMRIDMAIDLFGWLWALDTIIKKAEEQPSDIDFSKEIKIMVKKPADKTETKKTIKKKFAKETISKKGRPICQFTKDGVLVNTFASVRDALTQLEKETGKELSVNNIYQSVKKGKTAYGFMWKYGDTVSVSETFIEEAPVEEGVNPTYFEESANGQSSICNMEENALGETAVTAKGMLVAYYLLKDKSFDKTREIGRYSSQQDACNSLGINKGVLSNYLKGRKDSIFWNNEDGQKVRIGFEKVAA